jgi:exonuclease III
MSNTNPQAYFTFSLSGKGLKLYHLNIRSILPKLDELRNTEGIFNMKASVIAFTESHLSTAINDGELSIDGYKLFRKDRVNRPGGGIAVYVKNVLKCINCVQFESDDLESLWLEFIQDGSSPLLLCTVYRPPDSTVDWYEKFERQLHQACCYTKNLVLMGDFNIDFLKDVPKHWESLYNSYGFSQIIGNPTRCTNSSSTLIDHVYVSCTDFVRNSNVIHINISDHYATGIVWKAGMQNMLSNTHHNVVCYRKMKNVSFEVNDSFISSMNSVCKVENVNEKLSSFNDALLQVERDNYSIIERRAKRPAQPKWFNDRIKQEIRKRNYYKTSGQFDLYKVQRNKVVNIIKYEKCYYYKNLILESRGDARTLWSTFNDVIGNVTVPVLPVLNVNGSVLTDVYDIANNFNEYFINIASHVTSKLPVSHEFIPSSEFQNFVNVKLSDAERYYIPYISPAEVLSHLKQLSVRKATGLDSISASLIRTVEQYLILPLSHIINTSIEKGIYPSTWKIAKVVSLHKGGSLSDLNNFRPISILSVISKVIERHVHDSLYKYLTQHSLLCKSQFGFRKGYSCFTCLSSMVSDWLENINNDKLVGFIALDFRKAFDVLPHDILLKKLLLYGCDDLTLRWFQSYLSNRTQRVILNNVLSDTGDVKFGVPQGSILGPLLFILYINDMSLNLVHSILHKYADDTSLSAYANTVDELQNKVSSDLQYIESWCENNRMVINTAKSKCMIICTYQKRMHLATDKLNLTINGSILENVDSHKVLGVYIDKNLTWKAHIEVVSGEISKLSGLLYRKKDLLPFSSRLLFYNVHILAKIDYCLPLWGNTSSVCLDKVWNLQKRCVRNICNLQYDSPTRDIFNKLGWHNIYERNFYHLCINAFKILNSDNAPLSNLVTMHKNISSHNLRSNNNHLMLHVPFARKEIYKQSFSYSVAVSWNKLPVNVRSCSSVLTFKSLLNDFIMSNDVLSI